MNDFERYVTIVNSGETKRFHTRKMMFEQTVAQHSFNCALLAFELANEIVETGGVQSIDINPYTCMLHMLIHDVPEHVFGDVPGNIKGRNPIVKNEFDHMESDWMDENFPLKTSVAFNDGLTDYEKALCKFVDLVDCYYKAAYEYEIGNVRPTEAVVINCGAAALKLVRECDKEQGCDNVMRVMSSVLGKFYDDMVKYFKQ